MQHLLAYKVLIDAKNNWPDHPAIYDEYGMLTFLELYNEVDFLRRELIKRGLGKDVAAGVMARNGRNIIVGIFAIIGTGATVMPMSHQLKTDEVNQILEEAGLHFILDDLNGVTPIPSDAIINLTHGSFRFAKTSISKPFAPHVENPAFMRFTSGTTGRAKGVIISHPSAIERIESANKLLNLGTDDCVIWVLPIAYHFVVSILLYVRYGTAIAIAKDFLPQNIVEITNNYKGTLLYASPMQIRLLSRISEHAEMKSLKAVISTSAAISPDICKGFQSKYGIPVSQAYGIIEIGLPIVNYEKSEEHPEAVGYALPDYTVDILDENHNVLGPNEIGNLAIKGPGMFDAYLQPALKREDVLVHGYFLTADYASKTEDGLIKVEGRQLSMINVSGNKVFPEEVEGVLETIPEIKQARISGVPHPLMGQIVQAEIVLNDNQSVNIEEVLTYCRKRLSTYKIPQRVLIVAFLPMTGSGKIKRGE